MDYITYAVPFFLLALLIELIYGIAINKNTYRLNDAISNLFMGTLRTANKLIIIGAAGYVFYLAETNFAIWRMDINSWFTWIFAFVIYDFFYYWFHRISHERQIFWASHVAHHQSEDYNLSTALRQTGTGAFVSWVFYIPMFLIGIPSYVFISVASLNLIYQFWVHSEHIPKLGWFENYFVTASNHRVHHAQNEQYIDKNYGGVFIIWDRMFGTHKIENEDEPCIYGIRGTLNTFNPIWANLHVYVKIMREMWSSQDWKDKLYAPFARTGWSPKSLPYQIEKDNFNAESFKKFNPVISKQHKIYALFQYLFITYIFLAFIQSGYLNYAQLWVTISMAAFTMYCTSIWLDGKKGTRIEIVRLALCISIGIYAYLQISLSAIAISVLVYSVINFLSLPLINRTT
ncbi:MAG: sterol desaturase family protein [Gammaproteobacteria bacterium]|tara:strand:- start:7032 stop:8237 length:1206 start_codon:yes stop_codon:yes gene_type:complete